MRCRLPVAYNPDAPTPTRWLAFLDGLLYPEDIPTLQEYIGYCLIPSNKGQRMMVIKGNGGEGKSQIGAVLAALFGNNMKDGSIGKISENRFARADLEHILLCVDDDMRMEALRQTNYVKSIVTAQGKMDLERKGKQSYQGWMCARLLAFSNGNLQALFDRSDGFYRRQLVLTTKEKPADRAAFQFLKNFSTQWQLIGYAAIGREKSPVCVDDFVSAEKIITKQGFIDTLAVKPDRLVGLTRLLVLHHGGTPPSPDV